MSSAIARRLARLELASGFDVTRPRERIRIVVRAADANPSLEGATCKRTLCRDGTLMEIVRLMKQNAGPDELTPEEIDKWVESLPVQVLQR